MSDKIGFIGLTPQDTHELASPGPNITFTPPADAVQGEVDKLTEAGCEAVHLGNRILRVETAVPVLVSRLFDACV